MAREPVEIAYSDPYSEGDARPYLLLHVGAFAGPGGNIWGLLDTGADVTCLPLAYASLIGYRADQLESAKSGSASGPMTTWRSLVPVHAELVGAAGQHFEMWPSFAEGLDVPLWGRRDVLLAFPTLFDEAAKTFTLYVGAE